MVKKIYYGYLYILFGFFFAINISYCVNFKTALEEFEVVPDFIKTVPLEKLEIEYPSGVKVEMGNLLFPTQVKDIPKVTWSTDPNTFYTLYMADIDAPSREDPFFRSYNHWLVGNIPGNDIEMGDTMAEFVGSAPSLGSGHHRYCFVLYKQPEKIHFNEKYFSNRDGMGREKFSIIKFTEKYNLGEPYAANFYTSEFDNYSPVIHKQLGF